ncbi:MAG: Ribosomal small subunit methyltransferase [Bacteroidota bacterium]|jgi:16S rRNA (guanine527-N7)-methyltransferase
MDDPMGHFFSYRSHWSDLTQQQEKRLHLFREVFLSWNEKINLISRKDTDSFEIRHVLHSLSIARFIRFYPGAQVMDLGTGGGFPGIPLAIRFPDASFVLVDSIEKKLLAVQDMVDVLGLKNVEVIRGRAESLTRSFDYVVSRAVAPMTDLVRWTKAIVQPGQQGSLPNGWLVLKGGDLREELRPYGRLVEIQPLSDYWNDPFFESKALVYLPRQVL